jgi:sec-independent protein translocase protein TatA
VFGLGIWEILILVGVLVLLFGAKGAPAMARKLGTSVREVKDAVGEMDPRSLLDAKDEPAETKAAPAPAAPVAVAAPAAVPAPAPPTREIEATPAQRVEPSESQERQGE